MYVCIEYEIFFNKFECNLFERNNENLKIYSI